MDCRIRVLKPFQLLCQAVAFQRLYIYDVCMQKHIPAPKERMVRKQVYITAEQDRQLKELARKHGVAAAEIIRKGLQNELATDASPDDWEARKARILAIRPIWADRDDMDDFVRNLREGTGRRLERLGLAPKKRK